MGAVKKKIMLTGCRGMVGSNILESDLASNYDWLAPNRAELNLENYDAVKIYIDRYQPDIVIHAAGRVGGIQANMAHPVEFLVENIDIGRNVIMASKNSGIKKLINLSSSCIYPRNALNPLTEDMVLKGELEPTNEGYALAKIFTLRLCQYISNQDTSFQYKTLIPCNLYGRHDKFDSENSHLIPAIINKVHQAKILNLESVEIWGDGEARREFMYVGDLADFIFKTLDDFSEIPNVMNIGLGYDFSVNQYYEAVRSVLGWSGFFTHDLSKPEGMRKKMVSVDKLNFLGWKAGTSLEEGIRKSYNFYLDKL
jgi:GDP-L-fucose synthase